MVIEETAAGAGVTVYGETSAGYAQGRMKQDRVSAMSHPLKITAVCGALRRPSRTEALVRAIVAELLSGAAAEVRFVNVSEVGTLAGAEVDRRALPPPAVQALEAIEEAELLVVGTPVYRASYTGLVKHLFDFVDRQALIGRPVLLAATGGSERHALVIEHQLRPLFGFFQAAPLPHGVYATEADFVDHRLASPQVGQRIAVAVRFALDWLGRPGAAASPKRPAFAAANQPDPLEDLPMSENFNPIRFAYWVPNVSGGLVVSKIEQRTSWDLDYNIKLAQIAEASGFDYALSQIRFTAGYGAEFQHEPVAFSHALLAATKRLKVIAALLPGPWNPAVAAKQLSTIDQLTGGRVAINVVSGWFKGEFTAIGEHWLEHDERYRRSEEFIRALKGIWTTDSFTFRGDFYRFSDYTLQPKPLQRPHPEVFQGGSSRAARDMAARVSDWYFTNGNTVEGIRAQVEDLRAKAAAEGRSVKIGVNAFVIARDTEEEARAVLAEIIDKADPEAVNAFGAAVTQAGKASPEGEGNWAKSTFEDLVQYNDGFKTNLIGTPQQIADRIVALKAVGVDLILTGFLHFQEEVEYFGKHVLPRVRALEAQRTLEAA